MLHHPADRAAFVTLAVLTLCAITRPLAAGARDPRATIVHRLTVGGRARTYWVDAPQHPPGQSPWPVVVVLHGDKSHARRIQRVAGFSKQADAGGVLIVYPNGTSWLDLPLRSWNAATCCGYAMNARVDDVAFFRALLDDLADRYPIDPQRVFVAGMSNGGMMAYRLACELSDRLAAIAPIAGAMTAVPCTPTHPVSVMIVHGTEDAYVPYHGGRSAFTGDERIDPPVEDALAFWVRHNGCPSNPEIARVGPAVRTRYAGCRAGTQILLYAIEGGTHRWPGHHGDVAALHATDLILDFFLRQAKR